MNGKGVRDNREVKEELAKTVNANRVAKVGLCKECLDKSFGKGMAMAVVKA